MAIQEVETKPQFICEQHRCPVTDCPGQVVLGSHNSFLSLSAVERHACERSTGLEPCLVKSSAYCLSTNGGSSGLHEVRTQPLCRPEPITACLNDQIPVLPQDYGTLSASTVSPGCSSKCLVPLLCPTDGALRHAEGSCNLSLDGFPFQHSNAKPKLCWCQVLPSPCISHLSTQQFTK